MMRIAIEERRARVAVRHRLSPGAQGETPLDAARAVVALHSTDPATVFLSTWARTDGFSTGDLERALYEDRSLVRMLGMRRTLWVVPRDLAAVVDAACTRVIAARERKRLERSVEAAGIDGEPAGWIAERLGAALEALESRGEAFTADLTRADPRLAEKVRLGAGRWQIEASAGSRLLPLLAAEGVVARGRPRGSWVSGQYRWVPIRGMARRRPRADRAGGGAGRAPAAVAGRVRAGERDGYPLVDGLDGPGGTRRAGRRTARHGRAGQRDGVRARR